MLTKCVFFSQRRKFYSIIRHFSNIFIVKMGFSFLDVIIMSLPTDCRHFVYTMRLIRLFTSIIYCNVGTQIYLIWFLYHVFCLVRLNLLHIPSMFLLLKFPALMSENLLANSFGSFFLADFNSPVIFKLLH